MKFWLGASFAATDQFIELAKAADRLGYETVSLSDHMFYADFDASYPYTDTGAPAWTPDTHWPDVWVTIAAMAAVTSRVKFSPNVYIAPARDLFTVAKGVSTAAVLSDDRVLMGTGVGWCKDEFLQTGQDFHNRGRRLDEMLPALRRLWEGGTVEFRGDHYDFGPLSISPAPNAPVPVYLGGDSEPAMRRVARTGDGWLGNAVYPPERVPEILETLNGYLREYGRKPGDLDTVFAVAAMPDVDLYKRLEDQGVTALMAAPWWTAGPDEAAKHDSDLDFKIACMERFAEDIIAKV